MNDAQKTAKQKFLLFAGGALSILASGIGTGLVLLAMWDNSVGWLVIGSAFLGMSFCKQADREEQA